MTAKRLQDGDVDPLPDPGRRRAGPSGEHSRRRVRPRRPFAELSPNRDRRAVEAAVQLKRPDQRLKQELIAPFGVAGSVLAERRDGHHGQRRVGAVQVAQAQPSFVQVAGREALDHDIADRDQMQHVLAPGAVVQVGGGDNGSLRMTFLARSRCCNSS